MPPAHRPPGDDDHGKPCRSCTSFSEYIKLSKKRYDAEKKDPKGVDVSTRGGDGAEITGIDCPLDVEELGRSTWGLLHTIAAKYPDRPTEEQKSDMKQFVTLFSKFYPCDHCAEDFRNDLKRKPPQVGSQESLSRWLCEMHNDVNVKLGKEKFDCSRVNERWRDGWKDGSCG